MARSSARAVPDQPTEGNSPRGRRFPAHAFLGLPRARPTPGPIPNQFAHRQRFLPRVPASPPTRVFLCASVAGAW
jgi:hypothetical protein